MRRLPLLVGRLLFGGVFVWAAVQHMLAHDSLTAAVAAQNVPLPEAAVTLSTSLLALGGTSIILGFMPRIGLGLIMLFLVPVTCVMHAFWAAPDQAARTLQLAMFMKNLALLGACFGLFAIAVPWPLSLDRWLDRNRYHFGGDALARSWRRMVADAKRVFRHLGTRSRPTGQTSTPTAPAHLASPDARDYPTYSSGSYVVRRWTWSDDDSVIVQSIRAYRVWW